MNEYHLGADAEPPVTLRGRRHYAWAGVANAAAVLPVVRSSVLRDPGQTGETPANMIAALLV